MNGTHGFFHVALMNGFGGLAIALEMHGRVLESGLYDASDRIHVGIVGDLSQASFLMDYVFTRYSKYAVEHISPNTLEFEWPTLQKMQEHCKANEDDVWYAHTKGARNCRPDVPNRIQKNIRDWRGVMCHEVMSKHAECKQLLQEHDAVGPLLSVDKWSPHFVGNFWWARASHIRKLFEIPNEKLKEREYAEAWIGMVEGANLFGTTPTLPYDCYDFSNTHGEEGIFKGMPGACL